MKTIYIFLIYMMCCFTLAAQGSAYEHAMTYYLQGDFENSLVQLSLEHDSANAKCHYLKGKALENLYRYNEAIAAQRKALRFDPASKEAMSALAGLYALSGQATQAAELYGKLAAREPVVLRWKMSQALSLQAALRTREALNLFAELARMDSTNWLVHKNRGDCYARIDSLQRTAQCYEQALHYNPQNLALYGQLAALYLRLNNMDRADTLAHQALAIDSLYMEGLRCLGVINYRKDRLREASGNFAKLLELGDSSFVVSSYLGMTGFKVFHYDLAELYLEKALRLEPENMNTLYYLASTYHYTGKPSKGLALLDTLDGLLARYDSIRLHADVERAYLYRAASQGIKAAKVFKSVADRQPNNPLYYYEVAVSYDMDHNYRQAIEWYKRFLDKLDPNWEKVVITEEMRNAPSYKTTAITRVGVLKVELFYQEKKEKEKK